MRDFHLLRMSLIAALLLPLSPVSAAPKAAFDANTPVTLDPLSAHRALTGERDWRQPDYSAQDGTLGWNEKTFETPKGLEKRVGFWVDIYTKYDTSQGVVHDAENVDMVYEVVDFRDLDQLGLTAMLKEKMKRQMVDDAKKRAQRTLEKVASAKSPFGLTPAQRRVWTYFSHDPDPEKFAKAMNPQRLRFQLGQKNRMRSAIFLSGRYLEDFEQVFREQGLPVELTRLVFVESSFNVLARSKVGASGLWQLMPGTAKPHRVMSPAVDGRNHPLTATRIAAKLLASNYKMLGSWPLAVTGYNHGPAGVRQIVERYGTSNLTDLVENVRSRASFGFASRNFYASFLAAYHVEKNADRYFPGITWSKKFDSEDLKLPQTIKYADLLGWFGRDDNKLQILNPHLTWRVRRGHGIPAGTSVAIPSEKYSQALMALGRRGRAVASDTVKTNPARAAEPVPAGRQSRSKKKVHRVSRGENLSRIARVYGVEVKALLQANNLEMGAAILPGQRLRIPH
ncbi:MAG: transglycosylase SLT domain-containing protein [Bdellovibrionaceae bacterium]|nr:transglycosylase SLT domain-containing protein [Pseudobdellovibrionaceae bacterium]MBX3032578.1 transglycosylase SLT domain-containing protein [Pseudobdellovibrionaceae bacterium]